MGRFEDIQPGAKRVGADLGDDRCARLDYTRSVLGPGNMQDLNDLYYFAQVVAHGGFAPAGRVLRLPKSKLSRRVAQLEEALGVRLIERSTRRFRVTEVGQAFYERCRALLLEAEGALAVVSEANGEPRGLVRFSCPTGMLEAIRPSLPGFLARHPGVRLHLLATNKPVDLIEQQIDVALRVRTTLDSDVSLTMRTLGYSIRVLVASPDVAATLPADMLVEDLPRYPTLSSMEQAGEEIWTLSDVSGAQGAIRHQPRLTCGDLSVIQDAAVEGLGIALLPDHLVREDIEAGRLVRVLDSWFGQSGIVHLVFTTRRGMPPAVRALIDYLADMFQSGLVSKAPLSPWPPRDA